MCVQRGEEAAPHGIITHVGGKTSGGTHWKISLAEAIAGIRSGLWEFYVQSGTATVRIGIVKEEDGRETLGAEGQGEALLSLPDCRHGP